MKEPLRSALRDGNFQKARRDHELQLIPSDWIVAAQDRWTPKPVPDAPMCAIGVDVAQGGTDNTVLACRHDYWFAPLIRKPGRETPDGLAVAGFVLANRLNQAEIIIDMGGGYGGSAYEQLRNTIDKVHTYKGANGTTETTKQGNLKFKNYRAKAYYRLYEALDPAQPGGSDIALPRDPQLLAQLCSIRLKGDDISTIELERKVDLVKRIGVSPDDADAVVMAWDRGPKTADSYNIWQRHRRTGNPQVNTAKRSARRYKR